MTADERKRVEDALAEYIAPLIAEDGATLRVVDVEGDVVTLAFEGSYLGCPGRASIRDTYVAPLLEKELGREISITLA